MFGRVNLFKTVLQLFNCLLSVSTWVFKPYKYFTAPLTPFKSVAKCSVRIWLHLWPASKVWSQLLHLWLHLWRASKVKSNLPAYLRIWLRLFYPCQRNKQRGYIFGGIFDACQRWSQSRYQIWLYLWHASKEQQIHFFVPCTNNKTSESTASLSLAERWLITKISRQLNSVLTYSLLTKCIIPATNTAEYVLVEYALLPHNGDVKRLSK